MRIREIEPFYFGLPDKPLFGCYHIPQSNFKRNCGIVLCCSSGYEYIRFHRAFRQLSDRLANIGYPVLRFDFYGCGDSGGVREQGEIGQWLQDIAMAIDEIRKRGNVTKVCLVGLRLGGSLAMMVGAERQDVDGIVFWDPVVSGISYLEELTALHKKMLRYAHVQAQCSQLDEQHTEILGFPVTETLFADIKNIDILTIWQKPAQNILIIESNGTFSQVEFSTHIKGMGINVMDEVLLAPELWDWEEDFKMRVPHQILQSIVSWFSEVYP